MIDVNDWQNLQTGDIVAPQVEAMSRRERIGYFALGLAEEAGEVAGKIKKWQRGDTDDTNVRAQAKLEIGDVLWYAARLASELDLTLEQIMYANSEKLSSRAARGTLTGSGDNR